MAQHVLADTIEDVTVQRIVKTIRKTRYFKTSMRYYDMPREYNETETDEVYGCDRNVPDSLVFGGRATFEIHTEPLRHGGRTVSKIYMVA
jgi:hypothetical protein